MKIHLFALTSFVFSHAVFGWISIFEFEDAAVQTLGTNTTALVDPQFTNQLMVATSSIDDHMAMGAWMMLGVSAYQQFMNDANAEHLNVEAMAFSNAVFHASCSDGCWSFWMSRLLYAGSCVTRGCFAEGYGVLTNGVAEMEASGFSTPTNSLCKALLKKYEMPELTIQEAFKVFSGMTAAELCLNADATNFANAVSLPYRHMILEFVK